MAARDLHPGSHTGTGLDWITRTNWPAQTGGGTLGKPSPLTTSRNWLPGLVRGALNKCLPFLSVSGTAVPTVKVKGSLRAASALPPDPTRHVQLPKLVAHTGTASNYAITKGLQVAPSLTHPPPHGPPPTTFSTRVYQPPTRPTHPHPHGRGPPPIAQLSAPSPRPRTNSSR
jgi:hypothetical protein